MSELQCRSPQTPTEWDHYYDLRWRVLREPWHQPRGSERDDEEDQAHHAAVFADATVIAVGRLHRISPSVGQIRYMAVGPDHFKQGLGSKILNQLEDEARVRELNQIELDARETALGFYTKHGYFVSGISPTKWGIPHRRMRKPI